MQKARDKTVHKAMKAVDKLYNEFPGFTDIFDEETFYQFAFVFTACTFVCVFILSRYVKIRSQDQLDRENRPVHVNRIPNSSGNNASRAQSPRQPRKTGEKEA